MFRVGQKVVCVEDRCIFPKGAVFTNPLGQAARSDGDMGGLTRGEIYTVHSIIGHCLILQEICRGPSELGFRASRFRPVVERKTDIGFAHEILRKATKRKPATV